MAENIILEKTFVCPLCEDGRAVLKSEPREFDYKGDKYEAMAYFYKCNSCGEEFTTTESDTKTLNQVYEKHEQKHGGSDEVHKG